MEPIGHTLRQARQAAGLTQAELARLAGTGQGAVSAYETGQRDPTVGTLRRLLHAAGQELEVGLRPLDETRRTLPDTRRGRGLEVHRAEIRRMVAAHGGGRVGVFGSVARGDDDEASDLDLLVDLPARTGLFTLGRIACDVGELLGIEVDVVPEAALRAELHEVVLAEVIWL